MNQRIKSLFHLFRAYIFFSLSQVKKLAVRVVFAPSRDFLVLKRPFEACREAGEIEWIEYG